MDPIRLLDPKLYIYVIFDVIMDVIRFDNPNHPNRL